MVRAIHFLIALWTAWLVVGLANAAGRVESQRVTVATTNGRKLAGVVDARTNKQRLWLRQTSDNVSLATSIAWSNVASASLDGEPVNADTLQRRSKGLATPQPQIAWGNGTAENAAPPTDSNRKSAPPRAKLRMRNLEIIDSCLVNLDRDVEPDGLRIAIAAIGEDGRAMPVSGSLSAELMGERRPWNNSQVDYGPLDRWTQPVRSTDFAGSAATYVLPFRHTAPEWQFDVLPDAIITVRLGAFGQGNYAASAPVVIRPLNPMRDNRQLLDETRFMPGELHGGNPHNRLSPENGLWLHWTR